MTYYLTNDSSDGMAHENAEFIKVSTKEEALTHFKEQYEDSGFIVTGLIELFGFADCWCKCHFKPDQDLLENLAGQIGCSVDDIHVSAPGTHPGGRSWWITPHINMLSPMLIEVE